MLPLKFMQIFADDQGHFCLDFGFSFTCCINSNVLPQIGMWQYNSLNVQSWTKYQCGYSFSVTRNY